MSCRVLRCLCASLAASLGACAPYFLHAPEAGVELRSAIEKAHKAKIDGPAEVKLAGRRVLRLQWGLAYIPPAEGERLLLAMGDRPLGKILGVVISRASDTVEIAVIYAKEERIGFPDLEVAGWNKTPALAGFQRR